MADKETKEVVIDKSPEGRVLTTKVIEVEVVAEEPKKKAKKKK